MLLRELSQQNLIGLLKGLHELTEDSLKNQLYTDVSILSSAIATLKDETSMEPLKADKFSTAFTRVENTFEAMTDVVLPTTPKEGQILAAEEGSNILTSIYPTKSTSSIKDISDAMFKELILDSINALLVKSGCDNVSSYQLLDELKTNLNTLYPGYTELKSDSTKNKNHWRVMFSKNSLHLINSGAIVKSGSRYYSLPKQSNLIKEEPAKTEESYQSKLEIVELRPKAMIPVKANSPTNSIHKTSQLFNKPKLR